MATLVYSLDAANPASYPGSGSSWSDISGNTYSPVATATLYNAPTFTTEGTLKFIKFESASQQYADFAMAAVDAGAFPSNTLAYQIYNQSQSIAIWVRVDSALQPFTEPGYYGGYQGTILTSGYTTFDNENLQFDISAGNCGTVGSSSAISVGWRQASGRFAAGSLLPTIGQWYFIVGVYRKTGTLSGFVDFYVNGFLVGTTAVSSGSGDTFSGTVVKNNFLARSSFVNRSGTYVPKPESIIYSNISVSQFKIYQGALSASEIFTLFRASAAPFGYSLMATLSPLPKMQFFSTAGVPLVGGKLYTYAAGTTTPLATYTSQSGATANTNPIILDSRGEADVWLSSAAYKLKLTTAADVEIWTVDNVGSGDQFGTSQLLSSVSGTDTITATVTSPNFTAYAAGQTFNFVAAGTNATSSVTLNLNGLGVKSVTKQGSVALAVGDIQTGQMIEVVYDGTRFQVISSYPMNLTTPPAIGGTTPNTGAFTNLTTQNLAFSGAARRITADFSNATHANRTLAQTTTANSTTAVGLLPNGTSTTSQFIAYAATDPDNAAYAYMQHTGSVANIGATKTGTGSYTPLSFSTSGTTRLTINADGTVGIGRPPVSTQALNLAADGTTSANFAMVMYDSAGTPLWTYRADGYTAANGAKIESPAGSGATTGATANLYMASSGGNSQLLRSTSSLRYKHNIQDATFGLADVLNLRPVTFQGNNDGDRVFAGFIAEEIHDLGLTYFVEYLEDGRPDGLAYGNLTSLLAKAIQDQQAIIESLKTRIAALEAK